MLPSPSQCMVHPFETTAAFNPFKQPIDPQCYCALSCCCMLFLRRLWAALLPCGQYQELEDISIHTFHILPNVIFAYPISDLFTSVVPTPVQTVKIFSLNINTQSKMHPLRFLIYINCSRNFKNVI